MKNDPEKADREDLFHMSSNVQGGYLILLQNSNIKTV